MENTMNMTMGKRIFYYRKRMGMTQEQLAEQLGVTAQAVSKWEHDLSCPDVTLLPRLAEVFRITTDELLGLRNARPDEVKEGIVEGAEEGKQPWSWRWDWSNFGSGILSALFLVALGGLYLASHLCNWDVTFWEILWPVSIMFFGLSSCKGFSLFGVSCMLLGLYFLLVNLSVIPPLVTWPLVVAAFLILTGLSLLFGRFGKKKKAGFHRVVNFKDGTQATRENPTRKCSSADGRIRAEYAFCSDRVEVCEDIFRGGEVEVAFGSLVLDLQSCRDVSDDCALQLDVAFSSMVLLVPPRFKIVEGELDKAGCSTSTVGTPHPNGKPIILTGENCFGSLKIQYI